MNDFSKILDKARQIEEKMKESQEKIKNISAEGISGSNSVKVILNGNRVESSKFLDYFNEDRYKTIEIEYIVNNKTYSIIYTNINKYSNLGFPIYNDDETKKKGPFSKSDDSIVFASLHDNGKEIEFNEPDILVNILKKYSGPKGNFYTDVKIHHYEANYYIEVI